MSPSQVVWLWVSALILELSASTARIVEIKSHQLTLVDTRDVDARELTRSDRSRRSLFSREVNQKILDKHNDLRRLEYSSDMEIMIWNDYLSLMAEDWAKGCVWEHGQPNRPAGEPPFDQLGQNLYAYNGTGNGDFDPIRGLQLFYDEVAYYNYNTGACSKQPCGHYTQLVWATSREVGCAYAYCPSMVKTDLVNADYLVCNYGPPGNYINQKPYKKGAACIACATGKSWCDNGLCRSDCSKQNTKCECKASCKNCGVVIDETCTCNCTAGWHGNDCSLPCEDTHEWCRANPGWPVSWCNDPRYPYVKPNCPAMCSTCTVAPAGGPKQCLTTTTTTTTTTKPDDTTTTTTTTTTTVTDDVGETGTARTLMAVPLLNLICLILYRSICMHASV